MTSHDIMRKVFGGEGEVQDGQACDGDDERQTYLR